MSNRLFKSAINGYNKTEVDEYALHISRKLELQKREYEKKLEMLEVENKRLKGEKAAVEEKLYEDEAIIAAFRARLEEEIANEDFETPEDEESPIFPAEQVTPDDDILLKSKRYDEISRLLGEIIANANADAATVMREASEEAEKIVSDANGKANELRVSAYGDVKALLDSVNVSVNELSERAKSVLAKNEE